MGVESQSGTAAGAIEPSRSLQLILDAESRGDLGEPVYTRFSLSMWAYTRWLIGMQLSEALFRRELVSRTRGLPDSFMGKVAYTLRALLRHPRRQVRRPWPIVFFCSGVGNFLRDGVYFNRLADYFADCASKDTFLIEDSDAGVFREPRHYPNLAYHDAIMVRAAAEGKLRRLPARDRRRIDDFVSCLRELFGEFLDDSCFEQSRALLEKYGRWCEVWRREYVALFEKLQPRLVFVEDGCYGTRSHIVRWARERGIVTAEFQHGYIGSNHEAYNYHPDLLASRYRGNFPDYFLTYGAHWGRQMNIPAERVVIGNPHLSEMAKSLERCGRARTALFVSGDISTPLYREMLPALAAALPADVALVYRPHPVERGTVQERFGDVFSRCGISVDRETNAYQSVMNADLVIGDVSTLLFEADALGRPVVVVDYEESRKIIPPGLFPFISDFSELARYFDSDAEPNRQSIAGSELWAPDWNQNYLAFVDRVVSD